MPKQDEAAKDKANASKNITEETDTSQEDNSEKAEITTETTEASADTQEAGKDYLGGEQSEDTTDWKKRYSDSSREFQTLRQEAENYKQAMANLENLAQANPRILAEIEAAQRLATQQSNFYDQIVQRQVNQELAPIKKIAQDLQNQERQAKTQTFIDFEKKNPSLFPPKATEQQKKQIRGQIGRVVNALIETGMPFQEALDRAALTVNPQIAIQRGKDEAYLESQGETQAEFSSQTSAEGKKTKKKTFTPGELKAAEAMGVKDAMLKD